jgi:hypothetical protein
LEYGVFETMERLWEASIVSKTPNIEDFTLKQANKV